MPASIGFRDLFGYGRCWLLYLSLVLTPGLHAEAGQGFLDNFSSISLTNQYGQKFDAADLSGHIVLFSFIFTGCNATCPLQTNVLAQVLAALPQAVRKQVRFVSVSIDPANDTPAKLRLFAQHMRADLDGWQFVTGDVMQLQDVARRLHLQDENAPGTPSLHRTSLWLVDSRGRMLQRYKGNPPDRERLIRELIQVSSMPAVPG